MLDSGEEAPLDQLVDCIVTAQGAGFPGGNENGHATNEVVPFVFSHGCCCLYF
jgi:hypothetical protein